MKTELHTEGEKVIIKLSPETIFETSLFNFISDKTRKDTIEGQEKKNTFSATFTEKKLVFEL